MSVLHYWLRYAPIWVFPWWFWRLISRWRAIPPDRRCQRKKCFCPKIRWHHPPCSPWPRRWFLHFDGYPVPWPWNNAHASPFCPFRYLPTGWLSGHHRNVLLSLGSPATCTLASLDFLTGHRKVTLIQFYHPFQCIPCIPVAHRPAEFVYHRPYRFVTLQS